MEANSESTSEQLEAVELHRLQNRPLAEVSRLLERSKGAVAALLFRGLKHLRELLRERD
jgi:DNA-directed RNA polymerase specialized sigma24 family protein